MNIPQTFRMNSWGSLGVHSLALSGITTSFVCNKITEMVKQSKNKTDKSYRIILIKKRDPNHVYFLLNKLIKPIFFTTSEVSHYSKISIIILPFTHEYTSII